MRFFGIWQQVIIAAAIFAAVPPLGQANVYAKTKMVLKMQSHYQLKCLVSNPTKFNTLNDTEFCMVLAKHLADAVPATFSIAPTAGWVGEGDAVQLKIVQINEFNASIEIGIGHVSHNQFLRQDGFKTTLNASDAALSAKMARTLVYPISLALQRGE